MMDPVPNSPPENILSDREDPDKMDVRRWVDEAAPLRASPAVSDQDTDRFSTPSRQTPQHVLPSLTVGLVQTQIVAQENPVTLNVLPGVCPPLLNLQALSPGISVQPELTPPLPELIMTPYFCQTAFWRNMNTVRSPPSPHFGVSPCVLFPCSPFSPPHHPWLPLHEVHPIWCSCPQTRPVHQPCEPGLMSRKVEEPIREQLNVTPKSTGKEEQSMEKADSEEKQQKNDTAVQLLSSNTDNKTTNPAGCPGSPLSLDEGALTERAFEDYMMLMDSLCPKIRENVEVKDGEDEEDEDKQKEKLQTENRIFQEYLDELCSDEDFIRKVESILDIEFLQSLLFSDAELTDLPPTETHGQKVRWTLTTEDLDSLLPSESESLSVFALEEQQQEQPNHPSTSFSSDPLLCSMPNTDHLDPPESPDLVLNRQKQQQQWASHQHSAHSNIDPITDPFLEAAHLKGHLGTSLNPDGQTEPPKTGSKDRQLTDGTTEDFSPVPAHLCHNGSLFMEDTLTLSPYSPFGFPTFDLEAADHDASASSSLSGTQPAQLSQNSGPKGRQIPKELLSPRIVWCDVDKKYENFLKQSAGTSGAEAKEEGGGVIKEEENKENDRKIVKVRRSQRLPSQNEKEKARTEERRPKEKSFRKKLKFTPEKESAIYEKPSRRLSGGRQLFKREERSFEERSQATKITHAMEQFPETGDGEQFQKLSDVTQRLKVESGGQSEDNFCTKILQEGTVSNTQQEKTGKAASGVNGKKEGIERRRTRSLTAEEKVKQTSLSAAAEDTQIQHSPEREMDDKLEVNLRFECEDEQPVSSPDANCSPVSPSTPQWSQEVPQEALLDETNKEKHLTADIELPLVKTCDTNPGAGDFYSNKLQKTERTGLQQNEAAETTCPSSSSKLSPEQTAAIEGEEGRPNGEQKEPPILPSSPMKRCWHEWEAEKPVTEPEILKSPMKRQKSKAGVLCRRAEETSDCCTQRAEDKVFSPPSEGEETQRETRSTMKYRLRTIQAAGFPSRKQKQLLK